MLDYTKQNKSVSNGKNFSLLKFIIGFITTNFYKIALVFILYLVFCKPEFTSELISNWVNNFIVKTINDIKF